MVKVQELLNREKNVNYVKKQGNTTLIWINYNTNDFWYQHNSKTN